jgi:hypothetical protein
MTQTLDPWRMVGAPVEVQRRFVIDAALADPVCAAILDRAHQLGLETWMLCAGAIYQNVWNALTGRAPGYGINDYDFAYFDPDLSYEAEDRVIQSAATLFGDLDAQVEVRNQARVHLWFNEKYKTDRPALRSVEAGIDAYAADAHKLGMTRNREGEVAVYAPVGFDPVMSLKVAPCPGASDLAGFARKAERWKTMWPELQVRLSAD